MVSGAEHDPSTEPLAAEDARALTRLLRRGFGRGFRLVVIEVATPRLRGRVLEWVRAEVEALDGHVVELDVSSLPGENLWSELGERLEREGAARDRALLALYGFQAAAGGQPDERAGLYRQLNVQRDLFVRDFGCFWVVLIDPQGSRNLQDIAPDFCDFTSLWITVKDVGARGGPTLRMSPQVGPSIAADPEEPRSDLLRQTAEAITAGRYVAARDLLTRFELSADAGGEDEGDALWLRGRLELAFGELDAARSAAQRALAWSLARGKSGAAQTASALHLLGRVAEARGHYEEARDLLERSIETRRKLPGPRDDRDVVDALHGLARVHMALGQTEQARRLLERALKLHEAPHASAASLHELARVLRLEGDLAGARRALEQALELEQQTFGTETHPAVAVTLVSLGQVLHAQGELDAARQHVERSLEIHASTLGTELHPKVARSLHELATILREQGDLDGARQKLERSLAISAQVRGTEPHPDVAATLHELAQVLRKQGDLDGARRKLERALEIEVEVFGTELHPSVATILHSLAVLLDEQGERAEAKAAFERSLHIHARVHGPGHLSTCMTEVAFAQLLLEEDEGEAAGALLRHARPILVRALGAAHAWVQSADALLDRLAA